MITKKQSDRLKRDVEQGLRKPLSADLYLAFSRREWAFDPKDPYCNALVHAGILTAKGRMTKAGEWYHTTINGINHKPRDKR